MTYEQIEKEFDELFVKKVMLIDEPDKFSYKEMKYQIEPDAIKSFLKQSFIKYLQSEVERLEKSKKENPGTHICFPLEEITFTSELDGKEICVHKNQVETYNQAISDQITHLQAQIKELKA